MQHDRNLPERYHSSRYHPSEAKVERVLEGFIVVVYLYFGVERPVTVDKLSFMQSMLVPLHEYVREYCEADERHNRGHC